MKEGWRIKKMSEVCVIKPPKREAKERLNDTDLVSFLPMEDLGILSKDVNPVKERQLKEVSGSYTYFAENDVLLAKITPCFENGKIGIARDLINGIGFGSSEYIVFRSKGELIQDYLFYFLSQKTFREEGKKLMTGAVGHKRVSKEFVENYIIPFPESLEEQQRIVTILDEAFAAIAKAKANAEQNLKNAKELFESYLQSVFEKKGEGWEDKCFGDIITLLTDYHANGSYKILKEKVELKESEDYAWMIRSTDFENDFKNDFRYINKVGYDFLKKTKVFGDEIIMSKIGNAGKVYLMPETAKPCSLAMNLFLIRIDTKIVIPAFVYNYLVSSKGEIQIKAKLKGAVTKTITKENVRGIIIPTPPIKEQQFIIQKLGALSAETKKLEVIYQKKIADLEELKKSILQKAFSGELKTLEAVAV